MVQGRRSHVCHFLLPAGRHGWRPDFDGHQSIGFCMPIVRYLVGGFKHDYFPFFIYGILWDNPPTIDFICLKMGTLHQQPDLDSHETTFLTLPCNLAHTAGASRMTPLPFMSRHRGIWAAWTKAEEHVMVKLGETD